MAASGKVVEVLCPNGRRQKVKTNSSMTVLQVLQQVCEKQGYIDAEYDLKHQRKVLNVTSMLRFLNLPNNAKLELVKCEKARLVTNVTLAIQMEDGTRYQDDFNPDVTLLAVLKTFIKDIDRLEDALFNHEPVCIYMRNEYKGASVLSSTTLKSIGITTGRAAIRVHFRCKEDNDADMDVPPTSAKKQQAEGNNSFPCELEEEDGKRKKMKLGTSPSPSHDVIMAEQNVPSWESGRAQSSSEGSAYTPLSIIGAPPQQIFPDNVSFTACEDVVLPAVQPIKYEFANFKFPDDPCDNSEDVAIDPKLIKKEVKLGMPCDRQAIVFSMKNVQSALDEEQEPDDSFFQVTIDDLRKRLSNLKSERKSMEEEVLMTSRLRELKKIERASNFEMIPVRILLPDKLVLQGIFRPLETIGAIKAFLNGFLSAGIKRSELFVTPPRVELKDKNQTLYDAKLFPAAVVHASFGSSPEPYLKQEYLDNLQTSDAAEEIVDKILKRKQKDSNRSLAHFSEPRDSPQSSSSSSSGVAASSSSSTSSGSASFASNKQPKGAPKWFKTGR